jgi:hypothetical protein
MTAMPPVAPLEVRLGRPGEESGDVLRIWSMVAGVPSA